MKQFFCRASSYFVGRDFYYREVFFTNYRRRVLPTRPRHRSSTFLCLCWQVILREKALVYLSKSFLFLFSTLISVIKLFHDTGKRSRKQSSNYPKLTVAVSRRKVELLYFFDLNDKIVNTIELEVHEICYRLLKFAFKHQNIPTALIGLEFFFEY